MHTYTLGEITTIVGGKLLGDEKATINQLIIDSRTGRISGDSLFFAIKGEHHDGHNFIPDLQTKGILNFVVSKEPDKTEKSLTANYILVENTLHALQKLAAHHRHSFKGPVIGITGSNGKTIVKEWLYQCLSNDKKITRNPKSYNSQVGVPLSVWLLDAEDDYGIFEAGISQPGEMKYLQPVIDPVIGIFTNIGAAHQENFSSVDEKVQEKLELFKNAEVLVFCKDNPVLNREIRQFPFQKKIRLVDWSQKENAYLQVIRKEKTGTNTRIEYQSGPARETITIPFRDDASVENALQVLTLLTFLGYDPKKIATWFDKLSPVAMRLEQKKGINRCTLLNDSYNSDINSLTIALDYLKQQRQHTSRTVILSDILQSGLTEDKLYNEVASLLKKYKINRFIGIGEALKRNGHFFDATSTFYSNTDQFLENFRSVHFSNEAVLIKGARVFEFEKIVGALEEKSHQTVLEINLDALVHNLNYYRSLLNGNTRIMVMVKALSYGSGTYEIANELQHQRVDYLAVAYADEGIELRKAGITLPVMVMNPEEAAFEQMIRYNLEPELYNFSTLRSFTELLSRYPVISYPVHLKLDTGMHRLGFIETDINPLIQFLQSHKQLEVASIFSHLAASDDPGQDEFTNGQISKFEILSDKIMQECKIAPLRHILNSSGIERFPDAHLDMVRLGIGLHGVSPVHPEKLQTVSTLKSIISQIKPVPAGETIGYNRHGKFDHDITLGIVPIGYADGYDRKFGNGAGRMYINGHFANTVGDICMDMCMVDLTGVPAHEGDEVVLFGRENSIDDLSKKIGTIPYELLTDISARVKRIYFRE